MDDTSSGPPVASLPSGLQHRCRCPKPEGSTKQRKLIVCIDGTSNRFGPKNTNVVEFYSQIIKSDDQLTYYNSGIGTLAKPSWKSWSYFKRRIASYADQAIAWNLDHVLLAAYKWLANSYKDGDQIFLFGFSRGAYQVRILAAMIHEVGLILPGNDEQIPFAFETYCALEGGGNRELAATFKKTFSRKDVCAHFVGAWDTVSSVGFLRGKTFPSTTTSKEHMCFFRHALALDERRVKFLPEYIYGGQADQLADGRVKEVWFYGSHSDVGGGNTPNADLRSGNISLLWMRKEAEMAGLELEQPEITWLMKDLNNTNVESLTGPWWLAEVLPLKRLKYHASALHDSASGPAAVKLRQTPNFGNGRVILPGQKIHASVLFKPAYKPKARFLNNDIPWPEVMHFDDPESPERLSRLDSGVWEKDLFDNSTASFLLKKLVNYTKEGKENLDYLDQLVFMSRSEDGRQAIVKVPNSLVTVQGLMENANANVRLSGLVIYCELARGPSPYEIEELDVGFVTTMLKSDDMLERSRACSALPSLVKDTLTRGKLLNEQTLKTVTGSCRVTADDRIKLQSVQCLALLATHDGVPALIVDAGAVGDIRELLEDPHKLVVVAALKILTKLATDASAYSVLANTLPLPPMIRHAGNYDEHLTPAAVTAILALAQSGSATLRRQVEIARGSLLSIFEGIAQQTKSMTLRQVGRDAKRILDELLPPVNR